MPATPSGPPPGTPTGPEPRRSPLPSFAGGEVGREAIERRAIRADDLVVVAEVEEHVRMVERRVGAHAHELLRSDLDHRDTGIVMEVWDNVVGHILTLVVTMGRRNQQHAASRNAAHHTGGNS